MDAFPNVEDDYDLEEFLGHIEDEAFVYAPRIRLVDRDNPLEWYTDEEFFVRYRFHKGTVTDAILPMLRPDNADLRGVPVPKILQLLAVLRFYATGSFQVSDLNTFPSIFLVVCLSLILVVTYNIIAFILLAITV